MKELITVSKKLMLILTKYQKIKVVALLIASIIFAIFETLGVSVILPLTEVILNPKELMRNEYLKFIIELFQIDTIAGIIIFVSLSTICVYIVKNVYFIFYSYLRNSISTGIGNEISSYMVQSYMNRGYMYFVNNNSNTIVQGVISDTYNVYVIISNIMQLITKMLIILFVGIFMVVTDWKLAVGLLFSAFMCLIFIIKVLKKKVSVSGELYRNYSIEASKILWQSIWGIKELLVTHRQMKSIIAYENKMANRRKYNVITNVSQDSPIYIMEMLCVIVIMSILGARVFSGQDYSGFIGVLASFAIGAFRILPAVGGMASYINSIVSLHPSLDAVYENLIEAREYNRKQFDITVKDDEKYSNLKFSSKVSVKDLTFAYNEENGNVLEKLSMTILKGQSVGFVGESGAGKSTLSDIILGVISPDSGQVLIDDVPITSTPNRWGEIVGFVPQQIYLADTTIKENVAFFEDLSNIDDRLVIESLKKANIWDFICTLPEGIDTRIGDQGVRLSGGQRQRVGIARALYHQPEILVLDEATSALDNETEKAVMEAIDSLKSTMTLIIIAHRLTTIKNCDVIYEIKNGKAIERKYEEIV